VSIEGSVQDPICYWDCESLTCSWNCYRNLMMILNRTVIIIMTEYAYSCDDNLNPTHRSMITSMTRVGVRLLICR